MKNLTKSEMKIVSGILAHVEKNCAEVEEVEEYLWKILERHDDDCEHCKLCGVVIYEGNTSASSMHDSMCHKCENDSNS